MSKSFKNKFTVSVILILLLAIGNSANARQMKSGATLLRGTTAVTTPAKTNPNNVRRNQIKYDAQTNPVRGSVMYNRQFGDGKVNGNIGGGVEVNETGVNVKVQGEVTWKKRK